MLYSLMSQVSMRGVALMTESGISRGKIFVCYRREEQWAAGRLADRLADHFGINQVVQDFLTIEIGRDFSETIGEAVASCAVLLALIGDQWLGVTEENGQRRLDDPRDWVRLEIEAALTRNVPVIPILTGRARMPGTADLPPSIADLANCQAIKLSPDQFESDLGELIRLLEEIISERGTSPPGPAPAPALPQGPADQSAGSGESPDRWKAAEVPAEWGTPVQAPPQLRRPKIFLCYRRADTEGFARGIYESLAGKYGRDCVFRDIDSTPAGVRYSVWIESIVGQCSVMVVLIGPAWLSASNNTGQHRLELRKDWVRQEIEAALRRDIPIIPVRIQGAPMPSEGDLPHSIADLTAFQSAEVNDSRWDYDVGQLIQSIDNLMVSAPQPPEP
jgi:TIR domain